MVILQDIVSYLVFYAESLSGILSADLQDKGVNMEYYAFLIFGGMILAVVLIGVGVIIGGISEGASDRCDGDCVHSGGVHNGSDSSVGTSNESEHSGQDCRLDKETAVIALKVIKHDLHSMLSGTEKRAIDYAIDVIRKGENDDSLE